MRSLCRYGCDDGSLVEIRYVGSQTNGFAHRGLRAVRSNNQLRRSEPLSSRLTTESGPNLNVCKLGGSM